MRNLVLCSCALALFACAGTDAPESPGALELATLEQGVEGTLTLGDEQVAFRSEVVEGEVVEVYVDLHGMVLDAVIESTGGVASLDGFAAGSGADTQMTPEDRELLFALYRQLNDYWPTSDLPLSAQMLRRAVGLWAQHPDSMELTRAIYGEDERTIQYLCSYVYCRNDGKPTGACDYWNWYSYATHDGLGRDRYDPDSSQIAQLGDHYTCSGDEYYWNGSGWSCGEPDHWTYPSVVGNCFGRSGGGCGGDTQYTKDPTDHDGCVRNGHALASFWCDDEFTAASDDELFASNCY